MQWKFVTTDHAITNRYTNVKIPEESKNQNDEAETQSYDEAFQELKNEVEIQLFQHLEVLRMSSLRKNTWNCSPTEV